MADEEVIDGKGPGGSSDGTQDDAAQKLAKLTEHVANLERATQTLQSERDQLRSQLAKTDKIESVLGELATRGKDGNKPEPVDWEKLREDISENPGKGVDLAAQWAQQAEQRATEAAKKEAEALRAEMAELRKLISGQGESALKQSEAYKANQAAIDDLVGSGVPIEKAIAFTEKHVSKERRETPPGGTGGLANRGGAGADTWKPTALDEQFIQSHNMTKAEAEAYLASQRAKGRK